ncbi:HNH endonuclease [bacterium]|nr:HNH endonuclease [bacterium]
MHADSQIRLAAFNWLKEQTQIHGEVLSRQLLVEGFPFQDKQIPLMSPQGIFKPKDMKLPLTITTAPNGPYKDSIRDDGFLYYKYRGTNPNHRDNVGLRECMKQQIPLIYFHGLAPSKYELVWPVYIVGDDPEHLTFKVSADAFESVLYEIKQDPTAVSEIDIRRKYITTEVRHRIHQHTFRERVLNAYRNQCSFCRLRHPELLDAAHIIGDKEPEGEPIVNNGLALCKIHHAAFDNLFVGIRPDNYTIEVREDVRKEKDGPMLLHGLQEMHNRKIILPYETRDWPDRDLPGMKYEKFRKAI